MGILDQYAQRPPEVAVDDVPEESFVQPKPILGQYVSDRPLVEEDLTKGNAQEFMRGISVGTDSLQKSMWEMTALAAGEMGLEGARENALQNVQANQEEMELLPLRAGAFDDISNADELFTWWSSAVGQAIPSIGLSFTGGGIGGMLGRKALEHRIKDKLQDRIKTRLLARGATEEEAEKLARERVLSDAGATMIRRTIQGGGTSQFTNPGFARGAQIGAFSASAAPQVGESAGRLREAGVDSPGTALLAGAIGGAFEALPALRLVDKLFPGVDRALSVNFIKDFAKGAGVQGALEGTTEGFQEVTQLAALAFHDPNFDMFSPENRSQILEAFAQGAAVGVITGGLGEIGSNLSVKGRDTAKKVQLPEWKLNIRERLRGTKAEGEPELATNTFLEELTERLTVVAEEKLEPAMNAVRNTFQAGIDEVNNLAPGLNPEMGRWVDRIVATAEEFTEGHAPIIDEALRYFDETTAWINETAQTIPEGPERDAFIEKEVAEVEAELERVSQALTRRGRKTAESLKSTLDGEGVTFDSFQELQARMDEANEAAVDDDDPQQAFNREFERGDAYQRKPGRTEMATDEEFLFGQVKRVAVTRSKKGKKTTEVITRGEQAKPLKSRSSARGLVERLRKRYPSATDSTFEIVGDEESGYLVQMADPMQRESLLEDEQLWQIQENARISTLRRGQKKADRDARQAKVKGGRILDIPTLAFEGRRLGQGDNQTLRESFLTVAGMMFDRGIITQADFQRMQDKFEAYFEVEEKNMSLEKARELDDTDNLTGSQFSNVKRVLGEMRKSARRTTLDPRQDIEEEVRIEGEPTEQDRQEQLTKEQREVKRRGKITKPRRNPVEKATARIAEIEQSIDEITEARKNRAFTKKELDEMRALEEQIMTHPVAGDESHPQHGDWLKMVKKLDTWIDKQKGLRQKLRSQKEPYLRDFKDDEVLTDAAIKREGERLKNLREQLPKAREELRQARTDQRVAKAQQKVDETQAKLDKAIQNNKKLLENKKRAPEKSDKKATKADVEKEIRDVAKKRKQLQAQLKKDKEALRDAQRGKPRKPKQKTVDPFEAERAARIKQLRKIRAQARRNNTKKKVQFTAAMERELARLVEGKPTKAIPGKPTARDKKTAVYLPGVPKNVQNAVNALVGRAAKLLSNKVKIRVINRMAANRMVDSSHPHAHEAEMLLDSEYEFAIVRRADGVMYILVDDFNNMGRSVVGLMHELGHAIHYDTWESLNKTMQSKLWRAFKADVEQGRRTGKVIKTEQGQKVPQAKVDIEEFNEWMADQFVAWMRTRKQPRTAIEQFMETVAAKMDQLWNYVKTNAGRYGQLNETYGQFADAVAQRIRTRDPTGHNIFFLNEAANGSNLDALLLGEGRMLVGPTKEQWDAVVERLENKMPKVVQNARTMVEYMENVYNAALAPSTSVMKGMVDRGITSVYPLIKIFGREHGTAKRGFVNYHQRVKKMRGVFMERYLDMTKNMDEQDKKQMVARLRKAQKGEQVRLTPRDKQVQKLFEQMHAYLVDAGLPVGKIPNYFPNIFNRELLIENEDKIMKHLVGVRKMKPKKARAFYNSLISVEAESAAALRELEIDELSMQSPAFKNMRSRVATDQFWEQFYQDNLDLTVANYVNAAVKRSEYNRAVGERADPGLVGGDKISKKMWNPNAGIEGILAAAKEEGATEKDLQDIKKFVDSNLGMYGRDAVPDHIRKVMAGVIAYQNMRTLMFTVFASLPDLVGPMIRSGQVKSSFYSMMKFLRDNMKKNENAAKWDQMARSWGQITSAANQQVMVEYVDNHYMPKVLRTMNDAFFKYTGLNFYTDLTRKMALAVGHDYIKEMASTAVDQTKTKQERAKAKRALAELGLTVENVNDWMLNGEAIWGSPAYSSENRKQAKTDEKISDAMVQFVDESILSPNPSQRPLLANHPGFMLMYHLKGFMYAIHETTIKRILFNLDESTRMSDKKGQVAMHMGAAIAPAILMMALTAVGLELREMVTGSDRTARMDGWEYVWTLFERAGLTGVAQLGLDWEGAGARGQTGFAAISGPTIGQFADLISRPATQTIPKAIPGVSQLPWARNAARDMVGMSPADRKRRKKKKREREEGERRLAEMQRAVQGAENPEWDEEDVKKLNAAPPDQNKLKRVKRSDGSYIWRVEYERSLMDDPRTRQAEIRRMSALTKSVLPNG